MVDTQAAAVKSALFREMVRTALIISHQTKKCSASDILVAAHEISAIDKVSRRIPTELSASEAADEYIISEWDEFEGFRRELDYVHPRWTGRASPEEVKALIEASESEWLIDGIWQVANPAWEDLPGDDSNTLKLLAHIRDHEAATLSDLEKVLPHLNRRSISRLLKASKAEDGLIRVVGNGSATAWKAEAELLASRPAPRRSASPLATQSASKRQKELDPDGSLEEFVDAGKPFRSVQNDTQRADALKVLAFLRKRRIVSNGEIQKAVPQLDRYRIRRLLNRFQEEGLVQMHGEKAGVAWYATAKLLEDDQSQGRMEPPKSAETSALPKRKLDPLEKKVLSMIRRFGQVTNAEIRKEAPNLAHHQIRRLLQRMRDEGLIYVDGETKAAVWRLAEKKVSAADT
jgi:hypothetical protein